MAELPDVVLGETITSEWGNDIRDRTVQRYANNAARTAAIPSPVAGDLSWLADTGLVYVFFGSAWVTVNTTVAPVVTWSEQEAGGGAALTTSLVDKASTVFTKPALWNTYSITAWGTAVVQDEVGTGASARIEIGASNGSTQTLSTDTAGDYLYFHLAHSITAQTASPVTVTVAVAEVGGDMLYWGSTIVFAAYRLT